MCVCVYVCFNSDEYILLSLQFFDLDSVALGSYGYKWVEPNNPNEPPAVQMTIRKYHESKIDPAHKIFVVTPQDIITGLWRSITLVL